MQQDENYYTSDLSLAATLSFKFPIDHLDKSNPRRVLFYFKSSEEITKLVDQYWKKKLKVEPQTFFAQIRTIKNMIYEA